MSDVHDVTYAYGVYTMMEGHIETGHGGKIVLTVREEDDDDR